MKLGEADRLSGADGEAVVVLLFKKATKLL